VLSDAQRPAKNLEMSDAMTHGVSIPRILIAGAYSGVGKTTISIGLMGALKEKGFQVQAFKVGPDYIDPSYHTAVTGKPCRNLDAWMVSQDGLIEIFERGTRDADVAVIEGVMGLYDGLSGLDETGSTSQIAKFLRCPVILVIDAYGVARTAAALVLGYKNFDKNVHLAGIILNRISSPTHAKWCKEAIETITGIPVVGSLPVNKEIAMPERHLGLIPTPERKMISSFFSKLTGCAQDNIDLDKVVQIGRSAEKLPKTANAIYPERNYAKKATIGVAFDEAFNFYYQDNIDLLEAYGARVKFFSPIHDRNFPLDVDGLCLGGGFPEMLPRELEANEDMRRIIKSAAEGGMPIYAECGGLMYLTDSITDFNSNVFRMVGLLDGKTLMTKKLSLDYTLAEVKCDNPLSKAGNLVKGHEFHFSKISDIPSDAKFAYIMKKGVGIDGKRDAWIEHNVLASYMHLHFAYNPELVKNFIANCKRYNRK